MFAALFPAPAASAKQDEDGLGRSGRTMTAFPPPVEVNSHISAEDDHMVGQISQATPNPAFCEPEMARPPRRQSTG